MNIKEGTKFNKLIIIKEVEPLKDKKGNKVRMFLCKCNCGNKKIIRLGDVKSGHTKSCGCLQVEKAKRMIHQGVGTKEYNTWAAMKNRCLNKNYKEYKNYGGRGIKVSARWLDFRNFYKDMGDKSKDTSIDRIDNNGNYCKENCRWATRKQQANNRRNNKIIIYKNKQFTLAQWEKILGLNQGLIHSRLKANWSIEKILTTHKKKAPK